MEIYHFAVHGRLGPARPGRAHIVPLVFSLFQNNVHNSSTWKVVPGLRRFDSIDPEREVRLFIAPVLRLTHLEVIKTGSCY